MANMLFANNANTTLASSLTNVATTMSVTSASAFPSPTGSQYFYCTLADAATQTTIEIVKVTAVSGTTFTIVRGQDGTSGTAFASGAVVSLRLVRASLNDFPKLDEVNTFSQTQTFSVAPITTTLTGFVYGNGASAQTVATTAQALSLIGTVPVTNGGTGLTSLTANYIPYGNGTSAFNSSSNLTFDGTNLTVASRGITKGSLPAGTVLQVVNATYSTQINYASSTPTDTGLTASITPTSSTSKILVIVDQNGVSKDSNNTGVNLSLQRNGSNILANFGLVAGYTGGTVANDIGTVGATYLDSPGTTSSVTYKTQFASNSNNANAIVQQFNTPSTITLMEIAQ